MYKEERLIDGVWHYRNNPNSDFKPMSIQQLNNKVTVLKKYIENTNNPSAV